MDGLPDAAGAGGGQIGGASRGQGGGASGGNQIGGASGGSQDGGAGAGGPGGGAGGGGHVGGAGSGGQVGGASGGSQVAGAGGAGHIGGAGGGSQIGGAGGGQVGGAAGSAAGAGGAHGGAAGSVAGGAGSGGSAGGSGGTGGVVACASETNPPPALVASCTACISEFIDPRTDGCCNLVDTIGAALCQAASACMRSGDCNIGGDITTCYCGTNAATCDEAGQANGPCVLAMTAAASRNVTSMATDAPTPAQVIARLGDPDYALGRAANIQGIAGLFCPAECGF